MSNRSAVRRRGWAWAVAVVALFAGAPSHLPPQGLAPQGICSNVVASRTPGEPRSTVAPTHRRRRVPRRDLHESRRAGSAPTERLPRKR
jgi:hypothetical protein